MKQAVSKKIGGAAALSAGLSVAGILWLLLYRLTQPQRAAQQMALLGLFAAVAIAGWVGARFCPRQHIWPGLCVLAAAPATVYSAVAGPGALLGISYGAIAAMLAGEAFSPLYYAALPGMLAGLACGLALALLGALWLAGDIQEWLAGGARGPLPAAGARPPEPAENTGENTKEKTVENTDENTDENAGENAVTPRPKPPPREGRRKRQQS